MYKSIKISEEDYKKVEKIANFKKRKFIQILSFAVNLYYKITIGNRLSHPK